MNNIEVKVIDCHSNPGGMMSFLAKLTQRGHMIENMQDLEELLADGANTSTKFIDTMMGMKNHGTIKRFTPITVAIVGASRRFLAQARTNQVGFTYVSASLQYSDYTDKGRFVVPYALIEADHGYGKSTLVPLYLESCENAMEAYGCISSITDNDTAGYVAPQGLRNILIMQGNYESWLHFIRTRTCNRNTNETQYVAFRIWEELLKTPDGEHFFKYAGPDCMHGVCTEGKMSCGKCLKASSPREVIDKKWPLLEEVNNGKETSRP